MSLVSPHSPGSSVSHCSINETAGQFGLYPGVTGNLGRCFEKGTWLEPHTDVTSLSVSFTVPIFFPILESWSEKEL